MPLVRAAVKFKPFSKTASEHFREGGVYECPSLRRLASEPTGKWNNININFFLQYALQLSCTNLCTINLITGGS